MSDSEQEIGSFVLPSPASGSFRCGVCWSNKLVCRIAPGRARLVCVGCGNFAEWITEVEVEERKGA